MKPTATELEFAADVHRRDELIRAECIARGFTSKRNGWTSYPSDTVFSVPSPTNEERSRAEVINFRADPPAGSYLAYLTRNPEWVEHCGNVPRIGSDGRDITQYIVTTWTGDKLAEVTRITSRRCRVGWLTDTRGSFWARGIDGRMYHGRHNGTGIYLRMRAAKAVQ